jgi:hypothetical protein
LIHTGGRGAAPCARRTARRVAAEGLDDDVAGRQRLAVRATIAPHPRRCPGAIQAAPRVVEPQAHARRAREVGAARQHTPTSPKLSTTRQKVP